jgi:hypothetical protein
LQFNVGLNFSSLEKSLEVMTQISKLPKKIKIECISSIDQLEHIQEERELTL